MARVDGEDEGAEGREREGEEVVRGSGKPAERERRVDSVEVLDAREVVEGDELGLTLGDERRDGGKESVV